MPRNGREAQAPRRRPGLWAHASWLGGGASLVARLAPAAPARGPLALLAPLEQRRGLRPLAPLTPLTPLRGGQSRAVEYADEFGLYAWADGDDASAAARSRDGDDDEPEEAARRWV